VRNASSSSSSSSDSDSGNDTTSSGITGLNRTVGPSDVCQGKNSSTTAGLAMQPNDYYDARLFVTDYDAIHAFGLKHVDFNGLNRHRRHIPGVCREGMRHVSFRPPVSPIKVRRVPAAAGHRRSQSQLLSP
jgi:hypothetical protein